MPQKNSDVLSNYTFDNLTLKQISDNFEISYSKYGREIIFWGNAFFGGQFHKHNNDQLLSVKIFPNFSPHHPYCLSLYTRATSISHLMHHKM